MTAADGDGEVVRLKGHSGLIDDLNWPPVLKFGDAARGGCTLSAGTDTGVPRIVP